ncbi:hypothetical protein SLS58_003445 [Diplodia intermedia]|uniref:F-box domain-containing protein n=1 Tax=Diplodia intermedia TaxID=856260 RepID=A0ABR3TW39_9PEZI
MTPPDATSVLQGEDLIRRGTETLNVQFYRLPQEIKRMIFDRVFEDPGDATMRELQYCQW